MCQGSVSMSDDNNENHQHDETLAPPAPPPAPPPPPRYWRIKAFTGLLAFDALTAVLVLTPLIPWVRHHEDETLADHFTFAGSLSDLSALAFLRLLTATLGLLVAYGKAEVTPEYSFDLYHRHSGEKKSRDELEQEALEEALGPWLFRYLLRPSFACELLAIVTQVVCIVKCLCRMNVEIGTLQDVEPVHPIFWLAVLLTAVLSVLEATYHEPACKLAGECGKQRLLLGQAAAGGGGGASASASASQSSNSLFRQLSSTLSLPLLSDNALEQTDEEADGNGNEDNNNNNNTNAANTAETESNKADNSPGLCDITSDTDYRASWKDLMGTCSPDLGWIAIAFVFLILAAIAQVYIPRFLGNILDSLAATFSEVDDDTTRHTSMFDVPGFMLNMKLLVVASVLAGVFAGLRGSIFTVVGGRVNVRLRVQLMDSLLAQDIGFFDVAKTGEITSRLSSDTTLVGDQVSLNVNVFLRSLVQALGVLLFMFLVSWQLSILAFISVPVITLLSKQYSAYITKVIKTMQKSLADGNAVSEAALGSMSTIRAHDAAEGELKRFETEMTKYLRFNQHTAIAYCGYATLTTALPQLVFAVVVFYGGLLVRNGDMTSGQLVSFLLYLQSLSDAFASIGWVFSSLTQAVGAADKVFELMNRKPRIKTPTPDASQTPPPYEGILGIEALKTRRQRMIGLHPESARGEIVLENVNMSYPARPQRQILNGLSLKIEPGSIVALVGQSGGGKSSVMSLITHMYEHSSGRVLLDGHEVHELSPEWLSRHIAIVSQEPTLFGRSIRRNLMLGLEGTDEEPTQEEIEEAARLANADSFIRAMPMGYDTEVGERGVQLSGGQKQRIAIARALIRKPRILLLDEATSALDAESEHLVQKSIDDMLAKGRHEMTVIVIAHRLSTVRNADKIYVIKDGQVVEAGAHNELIDVPDGAYSALIRRQMQAQEKLENGAPARSESSEDL